MTAVTTPGIGKKRRMPKAKVNDIEMYYEVHDEGTSLLFLHGFAGSHQSWTLFIPDFKEYFKLLIPDMKERRIQVRGRLR